METRLTLASMQLTLVATPSFQPSGTSREDARVLAYLALNDLAVGFGPKFSRQIYLEALTSLIFLTTARGLTEGGEPEVVVAIDLEQSPSPVSKDNDEVMDNPPMAKPIL